MVSLPAISHIVRARFDLLKGDPNMIHWRMIQRWSAEGWSQAGPLKDVPKMIHWRMFQRWSTEGCSNDDPLKDQAMELCLSAVWHYHHEATPCVSHPHPTHTSPLIPKHPMPPPPPPTPHPILSLEILSSMSIVISWKFASTPLITWRWSWRSSLHTYKQTKRTDVCILYTDSQIISK